MERPSNPVGKAGAGHATKRARRAGGLPPPLPANRGILLTPFHTMALMCPDTTEQDVDAHTEILAAALAGLHG
ncbi:hypothetical protein ACWEP4_35555 [Streptomyces sp. NPDC004227]